MNKEDFQHSIDAYFEGTASPEMLKKLDRALSDNEELRVQFLESANLISELSQVLCGEEGANILPMSPVSERPSFNWRPLAMVATLVLGLGTLFYSLFSAGENPDPASLVLVEGWARFGEEKLSIGDRCEPPGLIVAGTDAAVVLRYPDGSLLTLEEGSALRLESGKSKKVFLEHGSLLADMKRQPEGKEMIMDTSNSTVTVLGTRYRLATTIIEDVLEVEHGRVRVLEKKTNKELVATRGSSSRVPGVEESIFPSFPADTANPDSPRLPVKRYKPQRSWFTEDFAFSWNLGLWEVKTQKNPQYHLWEKSEPGAFVEEGTNWRGYPTHVLNFSRPSTEGPPVCLRLSEKVGWDSYFLKYYYIPTGNDPFELNPLCLDLPEGTSMETIFEAKDSDPFEAPETWNRVVLQYLRYWNGEKWQVEVRRHLNFEHRSTVRLDIDRTPAILFDLQSGGCIFDFISVGQLTPSEDAFSDPFRDWLCTEDFDPGCNEVSWEVSTQDENRFYPVSSPEKGLTLQQGINRKGNPTNVLKLSSSSGEGIPSQLRFRRRVKWDHFELKYLFLPSGEEPMVMDPMCLQLPVDTEREILFEKDIQELLHEDSEEWNRIRLEFHRVQDEAGNWAFEVYRMVNDEHQSTTRLHIERALTILFDVKSGSGIFDWIDLRRLKTESPLRLSIY